MPELPTPGIDAAVILCDSAAPDPSGKMHMLGAGWSATGSPTAPAAVVVLMQIPWDRANERMTAELALVTADGAVVSLNGSPVQVSNTLEVGRPPGVTAGSPLDVAFHVPLAPMPLPPGRYAWRLVVADRAFSRSFEVRAPAG